MYVVYQAHGFGANSEPIAAFKKESDADDFVQNSPECGRNGRVVDIPLDPDWKEYGLHH